MRRFKQPLDVSVRRFVHDVFCMAPLTPVNDTLLNDLDFKKLSAPFPPHLIHADVAAGSQSMFDMSAQRRILALLPVTRTVLKTYTTKWAPFLVDTGAPRTFFTQQTIDALSLNEADYITVLGEKVSFCTSSGHFTEINLLGTDALGGSSLYVNYPHRKIRIEAVSVQDLSMWVRMGGATFEVTPSKNNVDALKDAVKAEMQLSGPAPLLTVKKDGKVLREDDALEATTRDAAYEVA